jgi:hypothetical protein
MLPQLGLVSAQNLTQPLFALPRIVWVWHDMNPGTLTAPLCSPGSDSATILQSPTGT